MLAAGVSLWISHVAVSCGSMYPDQVPAWWCLDLDSSMLWVEWPTLTWTAGMTPETDAFFKIQLSACCGTGFVESMLPLHRPVVVIGGSSDQNQETAGAFQEFPQVMHAFMWLFACWRFMKLTQFLVLGGGVSPLYQVLSKTQQSGSHPFSGREGIVMLHPC